MQNAAQAIAIASSPFIFNSGEMAIPAIIYALLMNVILLVYMAVIRKNNSKILIAPQIMSNFGESHFFMKTLSLKSIGVIIATLMISTGAFAQEISVKWHNGTAFEQQYITNTHKGTGKTITGTVTCDGIPVWAAAVKTDTKNGAAVYTNENGEYKISIPEEGATLTFSKWSMEPLTIEVKEQTVVDVAMKEVPSTYGIPEGKTLPPDANIVRGTVTWIDGYPIFGAYVGVVGTKRSVFTNWRGKFEIAVPKGKKLRFCMIGFKTVEVRVKGRDSINVKMKDEVMVLDDEDVVLD